MTPADEARLDALLSFVCKPHTGTPREFWEAFDSQAGDVHERAMAPDADPMLHEMFCHILSCADEAGHMVPEELMDARC